MHFKNTRLQTKKTNIKGNIDFIYKREDLKYFNDKVKIKARFGKSKIAIEDIQKFYKELSGNDILDFQGNVQSTINLLEAIRKFSDKTILIFSSTNKCVKLSFELKIKLSKVV